MFSISRCWLLRGMAILNYHLSKMRFSRNQIVGSIILLIVILAVGLLRLYS